MTARRLYFAIFWFLLALFAFARPEGLREYRLVRVVDGDTIVVTRVKDEEIHVRLLGIDCLETRRTERLRKQAAELGLEVEQAYQLGAQATSLVEKKLSGRPLYLETDPKLQDRYQRKLAYVWVGGEDDYLLNLRLLEIGQAQLYRGKGASHRYEEKFREAEARAKSQSVGIWAPPPVTQNPLPVQTSKPSPEPQSPPPFPWRVLAILLGIAILILGWRMK